MYHYDNDAPMKQPCRMKKYVGGKIIYENPETGALYYESEQKVCFTLNHAEECAVLYPFAELPEDDKKAFAELLELDQPDLAVVAFGDAADELIVVPVAVPTSPCAISRELFEKLTPEDKAELQENSERRDLNHPFATMKQDDFLIVY